MSEVKILLCDDDPDLLGLLQRRLKKMGIEPDAASDGRQAKGFVDDNNYDVIVTDIYMPEATGLEVMQYAKQKDAETQIVVITSAATLENAIDALNHGAFGYLTKPFDHLIVFDNMVTRALEYRTLIVADKRKAEAQKRRGDMLEDEVEQRVKQLQKTQKGLLDLLGSLPDGVLVVEEGGKVVLSSPVGEKWLAQDDKTKDRLIHAFVGQVHAPSPEPHADVTINDVELHLMMADFPDEGEAKRKAVIIREVEDDGAGAGSMVTDTVMGIKKGLATLYEQGVGTEVVLNVASQFAVLEQLQGWSIGTGELASSETPAPAPSTPAPAEPETTAPADEVAQEPTPSPTASEADAMATVPPFSLPRERTPTGELDGPRLNTSELQDALRATAPPDGPSSEETATEAQAEVDPGAETIVANPSELAIEAETPVEAAPAEPAVDPAEPDTRPEVPNATELQAEAPASIQEQTSPPGIPEEPPVSPNQSDQPVPVTGPIEEPPAPPWEEPEATADDSFPRAQAETGEVPTWIDGMTGSTDPNLLEDFEFEADPTAAAQPGASEPTAQADQADLEAVSSQQEPATQTDQAEPEAPSDQLDPAAQVEQAEPETLSEEPGPAAQTDQAEPEARPQEAAAEQTEASFPTSQQGEISDDDSMFKPRVIPEEMNAKLETPLDMPKANGSEEYSPPQHEGPITIQASQADTQIFRKVLEGLSGTQVLSGDYEKGAQESSGGTGELPAKENGDSISVGTGDLDELRAEIAAEAASSEPVSPSSEELRAAHEPESAPEPVPTKPEQWPPTLPTDDEEWDDELDVTG